MLTCILVVLAIFFYAFMCGVSHELLIRLSGLDGSYTDPDAAWLMWGTIFWPVSLPLVAFGAAAGLGSKLCELIWDKKKVSVERQNSKKNTETTRVER